MIRLAVVGAGSMGENHVRAAMGLRDVTVTVVVDSNAARAAAVANAAGVRAETDFRKVMGEVDAAVVAVPTPKHLDVAGALLAAGIDVLVEKPLAHSVDAARELAQVAETHGRVLAVGHVERFNPVVLELMTLASEPIHIEARRISPFVHRIPEGVTSDLMIHDLDLVNAIVRKPVVALQAISRAVRSDTEDLCTAILEFDNGTTASLVASRLGQEKVRTIEITEHKELLRADLIRQELSIHSVRETGFGGRTDRGYREVGTVEIPYLRHRGEPLFLELHFFVDRILGGDGPIVTAGEAISAMGLAERVLAVSSARTRDFDHGEY